MMEKIKKQNMMSFSNFKRDGRGAGKRTAPNQRPHCTEHSTIKDSTTRLEPARCSDKSLAGRESARGSQARPVSGYEGARGKIQLKRKVEITAKMAK
ncbi:hypothetical protein IF1G_02749 [Cordyceps javanica]|uniref:Uncharacterized protein n=1 Tax=Cordyceps javanica TaxID=43265 RepID=A0A545VAN5_9HYPO|nr:hypothetical protein IF1G_02749 [Cordyceps javanica]